MSDAEHLTEYVIGWFGREDVSGEWEALSIQPRTAWRKLIDGLLIEMGRPHWIKADPDDPTTWPGANEHNRVLVHARRDEGPGPRITRFTMSPSDVGTILATRPSVVLHWMPWDAIGDPS